MIERFPLKIKEIIYKDSIVTIFIIFSVIMGIMFSVMIPIPRVQDEQTHFKNIAENMGLDDYESLFPEEYEVSGSVLDAIKKDESLMYRPFIHKEDYKSAFLKENTVGLHFNSIPNPIKLIPYTPGALGLFIGGLLKLPLLYIFHLMDFLSLLFYIVMGVLTLKLAPIKRDLFLFILLLPTALSLAASCNYDCMLLSLSSFNLAYILNLKLDSKPIGFKSLIILFFTTLIIALTKIPYILLSTFIFLIPLSRFNLPLKIKDKEYDLVFIFKKIRVLLFVFLFIVALVGIFTIDNPNTKALAASILAPKDALSDIFNTIKIQGFNYLIGLALCIGHYDYSAPFNYFLMFSFFLVLFNIYHKEGSINYKFRIKAKLYIWLVLIVVSIMIILSQYIWQLRVSNFDLTLGISSYMEFFGPLNEIEGVQGRYFIPLVIPLFLTFDLGEYRLNIYKFRIIEIAFFIFITLYSYRAMAFAYWT